MQGPRGQKQKSTIPPARSTFSYVPSELQPSALNLSISPAEDLVRRRAGRSIRAAKVTMVSASKAARQAKRAEDGKDKKKTVASKVSSKAASNNASSASSVNGDETPPLLDGDGDPLPDSEQPATTDEK
ncbi:MAG: hypothetical protein Q9184_008389, partial [Pyrenodesmia sp. 2 TL-2023]